MHVFLKVKTTKRDKQNEIEGFFDLRDVEWFVKENDKKNNE